MRNLLIVIGVVGLVAGVAYYKQSQRQAAETPASLADTSSVAEPTTDIPTTPAAPDPTPAVEVVPVAEPTAAPVDVPVLTGASEPVVDEPTTQAERAKPQIPTTKPAEAAAEEAMPLAKVEAEDGPAPTPPAAPAPEKVRLPRMVDIGAHECIPCKKMAPILKEIRKEYAGKAEIVFVDVWKNPSAGDPYKVEIIPTQVFFDSDGKEVWRHVGFLSKKDIKAKLAEMGVK